MSKRGLKESEKLMLMGRAAGRCELCGKKIYEDSIQKSYLNISQYAHIVADSSNGPRGSEESDNLATDINNFILLCPGCHKLIDSKEGAERFSADILQTVKHNHEQMMERLTDIRSMTKSTILVYGAKIDDHDCPISQNEILDAIIPAHYPDNNVPVQIRQASNGQTEKDAAYWDKEMKYLQYQFDRQIKERVEHGDTTHISVFALAPQPLLAALGSMVTDIVSADVYQLHREPRTWRWQEKGEYEIKLIEPDDKCKKPVLVFALSSNIVERIKKRYEHDEVSMWIVTINEPNNDYMKTKEQISTFRSLTRHALEDINHHAAPGNIDVYMAMSNACAVELGRLKMSKADRKLNLFDYIDGEDRYALTI